MKISEYSEFDGVGLAHGIVKGDFSATEVVECAITAIEQLNPQLNAVVMKNYDVARQSAASKLPDTPLAGAPFLLKDVNVFSQDMPTTFSCLYFKDAEALPDSVIVQRWRQAGLSICGKSNTPEFAEDFVCESTFRGVTLNPWDAAITTGGSSGGAGASVACGMIPIAHATDLGGSIRIPAACCGVYGFKPTTGLCPVDHSQQELASGHNSDHVITRTVRDSAAMLDISAYPILGNRYPIHRSVPSYLNSLNDNPGVLKIGVCTSTPWGVESPARQQRAVQVVKETLIDLGHEVVEYVYPNDLDLNEWMDTLWMFDVINQLERHIGIAGREPRHDELEALTWHIRDIVKNMSAMDHYHARINSHQVSVKLITSMQDLDLVLTPALASDPIAVGSMDSRTDAFDYDTWRTQGHDFAPFSYVYNITGQPSASLPIQLKACEAPCAVQLSGHNGKDEIVLQVSQQLQNQYCWDQYRPPIWVG